MMPYNQYEIDKARREALRKQAENYQRADVTHITLLDRARYQLGELLTTTGRKLQQRYTAQQNLPTTDTGTFYRVDPA